MMVGKDRKEFYERVRDKFASKYRKQIAVQNVAQILDCMRDVAIEILKEKREFILRDIITLKIKEPHIQRGYNSFRKEPQDMHIGLKIRAKVAQGFLDDVIND